MGWTKRQGIMLCQPLDERNLARNWQTSHILLAQPKLDGMRCWVGWEHGEPILWSSEGNIIQGVPHINYLLKQMWEKEKGAVPNYDGELYIHGWTFEDIISVCKRGGDNLHEKFVEMEFHIFDYKSREPQLERTNNLQRWYDGLAEDVKLNIKLVPTFAVTKDNLDDFLSLFVAQGYEGIIVRNPAAPYVEKRPWTILKWKPSKHDTYKIVQVDEAISSAGVPLGRVGSLVCQDRFGNTFSVGPGLGITLSDAADLWLHREELVGRYAQVYYQNLTERGVPRFGKFSLIIGISDTGEEHPF